MKIMIESTPTITEYNGARVRMWKGTTERGVECTLYIAGVQVNRADDTEQFEQELQETSGPPELQQVRPLHQVFDTRMF